MAAKTPLKDSLYKLLGKGSAPSDNGRAKAYVYDLLEEDAQVALALTMKPDEAVAFLLERREKSESSLPITPCTVSCRPMHASEFPRGSSHELLGSSEGMTS